MKSLKNLLLIIVSLLVFLYVFSPSIGKTDIYLSSSDQKYFLLLVQEKNKKAIENMLVYYEKKKEKRNLFYLKCFLSHNCEINHTEKCPNNALSLINSKHTIYKYLAYKLSPILQKGTAFLVRYKDDLKYE